MSTAQTLLLGAIAGLTIFIGLPMGRMHGLSPQVKSFFTATATGILLFLFWDVLSEAIDPVESALHAHTWGRFAGASVFTRFARSLPVTLPEPTICKVALTR